MLPETAVMVTSPPLLLLPVRTPMVLPTVPTAMLPAASV
jgi:hypothetical protein